MIILVILLPVAIILLVAKALAGVNPVNINEGITSIPAPPQTEANAEAIKAIKIENK